MPQDSGICIIGAGLMGKGLVLEVAARLGRVKLITLSHSGSVDAIISDLRGKLERAKWCSDVEATLCNVHVHTDVAAVAGSRLVIECIIEDHAAKRGLYTAIKPYVCDAFVATNTSSLSIDALFEGILLGSRTLGMHFFNPVHAMKLVEVVRGHETSASAVEYALSTCKSLGKEPVIVKDSPGFIVNRLLIPLLNEACKLIDEGVALPADIDKAMMLGANHPLGPLGLSDLIGNDITLKIMQSFRARLPATPTPATSLEEAVANNHLGRKTGRGFHVYAPR